MCGFVCLWKVGDSALARRMIDKITHRGPDGLEVKRAPNVPAVMAHCRLAIIGPENGTQPLYGDDELLVANGEIYNHTELRAILGEALSRPRATARPSFTFSARMSRGGLPGLTACSHSSS